MVNISLVEAQDDYLKYITPTIKPGPSTPQDGYYKIYQDEPQKIKIKCSAGKVFVVDHGQCEKENHQK